MLFSSNEFIFLFLPITAILYFLIPKKLRNAVLLVMSLIFYAWGEPIYLFLMIGTIAFDFLFGLLIASSKAKGKEKRAKIFLVTAVTVNLASLAFFKYTGFLLENIKSLPIPALSSIKVPKIALPIGISFYTFQSLTYVIDVYRAKVGVSHSPVNFGAYVTMFPQLIAGPIVKYSDVEAELHSRNTNLTLAAEGARRFVCGLCKKVLVANAAGEIWKNMAAMPTDERSVLSCWLGIICFSFQIYFDFSGYSDMAIGLGKIFGFKFPENFNYPYISRSVTDFWRRWHMTLSGFFRDYVYIPLGGNRKGMARTIFNMLVVWALTGLWHGASWNFILWGLYYFVILALEKLFLGKKLEKLPSAVGRIYALFFIVIGWLIFASDGGEDSLTLAGGLGYLGNMFGIGVGAGFADKTAIYELLRNGLFLVIAGVGSTPLASKVMARIRGGKEEGEGEGEVTDPKRRTRYLILANTLAIIGFVICVAYLVDLSYNPFLYFRF